jgi:predicted membrane protein
VYGLIIYNAYHWLAKFSLLYAYLGNLLLIIAGLAMDVNIHRLLRSKSFAERVKNDKDKEMNYRFIKWFINSFVSLKTVLYVLYVFVLILSQISNLYPEFLNEDIRSFIHANDYSIMLLLAFDTIFQQFTKDRAGMRDVEEEFEKNMKE